MAVGPMAPTETGSVRGAVPTGVRWSLPCLTLLLIALAVYQLVYLVPRCTSVMQHLGVREPGYFRLLLHIPPWATPTAAVAFAVVALWQRGSVGRSALLATLAVAINAACLLGIVGGLFQVLTRVQ